MTEWLLIGSGVALAQLVAWVLGHRFGFAKAYGRGYDHALDHVELAAKVTKAPLAEVLAGLRLR